MDLIEPSFRRLRERVSRFVAPSAALRNVRLVKAQIELRGLAMKDKVAATHPVPERAA